METAAAQLLKSEKSLDKKRCYKLQKVATFRSTKWFAFYKDAEGRSVFIYYLDIDLKTVKKQFLSRTKKLFPDAVLVNMNRSKLAVLQLTKKGKVRRKQ